MLSKTVNLRDELALAKTNPGAEADILASVAVLLAENELERNKIRSTLRNDNGSDSNHFQFDLLETDRIFHISHIKKVCMDYRLRFLESSFYKNGIPEEAVSKIRKLEQLHD